MTSQNIIFPSKVTVSERILVGRQPFFHRYGEKEYFAFFPVKVILDLSTKLVHK